MIPKIFHQIWIGPNEAPFEFTRSWEKMAKINNWAYKLWRDKDIDHELPLNIKKLYDYEDTYQGKADVARYYLLNKYGGIYADCDMIWLGNNLENYLPLDTSSFIGVPEYPSSFVPLGSTLFIANGFFASEANSEILNKVISKLPENLKKSKSLSPGERTGPNLLNKCITKPIVIIPYEWIFPKDFHSETGVKDPMIFKDKALAFTYNTNEYPHNLNKKGKSQSNNAIYWIFLLLLVILIIFLFIYLTQ